MKNTIILDAHVHIYPCYRLGRAIESLLGNLASLRPEVTKGALLAERFDCHFFEHLQQGDVNGLPKHLTVKNSTESEAVVIHNATLNSDLYLFAGRQVVTAERVEVLASLTTAAIADGLGAETVVDKILDNGGVPIVSWAPGKWFFKRKKVVTRLLNRYPQGALLLGDTTLRPLGWPVPALMQQGQKNGYGLVAGSDPLPFEGEERYTGTYATVIEGDFNPSAPVNSLRKILLSASLSSRFVGTRNRPPEMGRRLIKNFIAKRRS